MLLYMLLVGMLLLLELLLSVLMLLVLLAEVHMVGEVVHFFSLYLRLPQNDTTREYVVDSQLSRVLQLSQLSRVLQWHLNSITSANLGLFAGTVSLLVLSVCGYCLFAGTVCLLVLSVCWYCLFGGSVCSRGNAFAVVVVAVVVSAVVVVLSWL
eukprot:GHVS01093887.1.p1 GENE.GHVS01093887.1~~GHVS01093887.1.p1  ORF type:complete len:154 (-),score=27.68 GHVS01093887.1:2-463(-)